MLTPTDHITQFAHHVIAWQKADRAFERALEQIPSTQFERLHRMQELHIAIVAIRSGYEFALDQVIKMHNLTTETEYEPEDET